MMKKLFLLTAIVLFSLSSFANEIGFIQYKRDTKLPGTLQALIDGAIMVECDYIVRAGWKVSEVTTTEYTATLDTLASDLHYRTLLAVEGWDADGYHPLTLNIVVESVNKKPYSAKPEYHILSLDGGDYCKRK
jgi:hypothetical protein